MIRAFELIKTEIGKDKQVLSLLRDLEGIKKISMVTGEFDIIVVAESDHMATLMNVVIEKIRCLDGISDTNTSIVIK